MPLGFFEGFPQNIHFVESYTNSVSNRQLQQRLIRFMSSINRREFAFEEVAIPTVPQGIVIFEFGIAEEGNFNFLNAEEAKRASAFVGQEQVASLDFFCSIRYYRGSGEERTALKFDYYMLRMAFDRGALNVQVVHERGPRYLSPQDLLDVIVRGVNGDSARKILRQTASL